MTDYNAQSKWVGKRLMAHLVDECDSQQKAAERLEGMHTSTIAKISNGTRGLSLRDLLKICDVFGLDAAEVLTWTTEPPAPETITVDGRTYRLAD